MPKSVITIQLCSNGYMVTDPEGMVEVVQKEEDLDLLENIVDARAFVKLVLVLQEMCGAVGSRYDAERFTCGLKPGDKYEPERDPALVPDDDGTL